jgi:DNA-binding Lrp family transcriptional regulator
MLSQQEIEIVRCLQGDIPLVPRPFSLIAEQLGMEESELLKKVQEMQQRGIIRRFGAILRHRKAGVSANAMVVWEIPADQVERVGPLMAAIPAVTHCYQRPTASGWPYNLFTMVHGQSREECEILVQALAESIGQYNYRLLYGTQEFKKTSMRYFEGEEEAHSSMG